jgi:general secretion pathway protein K
MRTRRRFSHLPNLSRQRGVAVVTALLLTTLAITIVASLFWQQQVQVRSIENQRLQLQKEWILRGALDWSQVILQEDARHSGVDHLGEPWAVSLAETRLDQYLEKGNSDTDVADGAIHGSILDAQSLFNLTNLCPDGKIAPREVEAFGRLLGALKLSPTLAQATADMMVAGFAPIENKQPAAPLVTASQSTGALPAPMQFVVRPAAKLTKMRIEQVDDLLAVPGFTPEALAKLKKYVVVLPKPTALNVNTANPEVMAAAFETVTRADAAEIVASRDSAWFKDSADFANRMPGKLEMEDVGRVGVRTGYFLVNGSIRVKRAEMNIQALIERQDNQTKLVWIKEI